jgi:DinB superfamily
MAALQAEVDRVLDQLERGPEIVVSIVREIPPHLVKRRPAPGVWSAHEHAVHLPAIHPLMLRRLGQMLTEPDPFITPYEPSRDEPDGALLKVDLDEAMDRYVRERGEIIARLRRLTPDQWAITAGHGEYGRYGVFIMFRHVALHDMHHAYKIEDRLLRKEWPDPA